MERYIELIEPFDQNGNEPRSAMATSPNGDWVLYSEAQAEIERLRAEVEGRDNHTMIWRREIINPSMAHMGAALVALRNGDTKAAEDYLENWLDVGGVCYELYTSHEVFFKRFHTDFMCDHTDKEACLAEIAEFNRRMTEDQDQREPQEQDDEN